MRVCQTCSAVYGLIEQARDKALAKIDAQEDRLRRQNHRSSSSSPDRRSLSPDRNKGGLGDSLSNPSMESPESEALALAAAAINSVTKGDVSELRSFRHPPPAVTMVTSAVMILLHGVALPWDDAKRVMLADGFVRSMLEVTPETITPKQLKALMPYLRSPVFRPEAVAPVSLCAAKFCAWVLGTLEAYKWQSGQGHVRLSLVEPRDLPQQKGGNQKHLQLQNSSSYSDNHSSVDMSSGKLRRKRSDMRNTATSATSGIGPASPESKRRPPRLPEPSAMVPRGPSEGQEASAAAKAAYNRALEPSATHASAPPTLEDEEAARRQRLGKRIAQGRQMTRLAGGSGPGASLGEDSTVFTCSDGITKMPYEVWSMLT